jgi:hypothetical protein
MELTGSMSSIVPVGAGESADASGLRRLDTTVIPPIYVMVAKPFS